MPLSGCFVESEEVFYTDSELLNWLQLAPNPRLSMLMEAWKKNKGGVSLRGTIIYLMEQEALRNENS